MAATAVWAAVLAAPLAQAQAAAADCNTTAGIAAMQEDVQTQLDVVKREQKAREAEIDRTLAQRAAANGWSKDHQTQLFATILGSPKFAAFEKEKQPLAMEVMSIAMATDPKQTCPNGQRLKVLIGQIKEVNVREYGYMLDQVKAAK